MNKYIILLLLGLFFQSQSFTQDWKSYPYTPEGKVVEFPKDEGVHADEPVDWWYFSMHMYGETTGDYYTVMVTYFSRVIWGFDGFRIFNIANETKNILYSETLPVEYDLITQDSLNLIANVIGGPDEFLTTQTNPDGTMKPFMYEISSKQDSGAIDLKLNSMKRPLIYGDSGFFYQGEQGNYTYYYALTDLDITGTVRFGDFTEEVTGVAWLDRQWGNFSLSEGEGYEWFSAHLSNGVDIGFYNIFSVDNSIYQGPDFTMCNIYYNEERDTVVYDFTLDRLEYSYASDTGNCYSQVWHLVADEIDVIVTTIDSSRQVLIPVQFYEGATTITGTVAGEEVTGIGFAELVHYYDNPVLSFSNPDTSTVWTEEGETISWTLANNDDGNPLYYDLYYSTDFGENYELIVEDIKDKSYYWDFSHLGDGTYCMFKLIGSSIDNTLSDTIVSDTVQVFVVTDVNMPKEIEAISVFPNPSTGVFSLAGKGIELVEVRNMRGQLVYKTSFSTATQRKTVQFDLGSNPNGIYFLSTKQNGEFSRRKIILNK